MTSVAIWGSYHYGNFGDDLMAEVFSSAVMQLGASASVISRNPELARASGAHVYPDLDALPNDPDLVIIGGGAMLSSDRLIDFLARPASRAVDREFGELLRYCRSHSPRVVPLSIGGDGDGNASGIWGNRRKFFNGPWAGAGTVRLAADVQLTKGLFRKNYSHYPDVLFAASQYLSRSSSVSAGTTRPIRLGINLHKKRAEPLVGALQSELGAHIILIPLITHSEIFGEPYEWTGGGASIRYETVPQFVDALSGLDGIVSDKLHVGLVSATLGVPFVSYQPKAKTRGLHSELRLLSAVADTPDEAVRLVSNAILEQTSPTMRDRIESDGLQEKANAHFELLREALDQVDTEV